MTIGNHIRDMVKFPRVSRADSRRIAFWRTLANAARAIEEPDVNSGRVDLADTLHCKMIPDENLPWECSSEELRRAVLGSFRKVRFTAFRQLAAALQEEQQNAALQSTARLLRLLR
jgi:hypothetical protein